MDHESTYRRLQKLRDNKINRVFILRPDNLGDLVLFSGALPHIRAHYPQAEITLCVKRYLRNLLELCPHVDRLLCWEDALYNLTGRPTLTLDWLPEIRGRWRLQTWLRALTRHAMRLRYRTDVLLLPAR